MNESEREEENTFAVFGYASILWKPEFEYDQSHLAYLEDYKRVFWLGSVVARGKPGGMGRCATLVSSPGVR